MGQFVNPQQGNQQIAIWNGIRFVVDFRRRSGTSSQNPPHFGFDWIDVNNEGEITKHHNNGYNKIQFVLAKNRAEITSAADCYVERNRGNREIIQNCIETEFPIYSIICSNNRDKLYTSKSWVSFPDHNSNIELRMIIREDKTNRQIRFPGRMFFEIPEGLSMTIGNNTYDHTSRDTQYNVPSNSYIEISITNTRRNNVGANLSIRVWENTQANTVALTKPIGELGIIVNEMIVYPVMMWPFYSFGGNINSSTLSLNQVGSLRNQFARNFNQTGVSIDLQINPDNYITYDKSDPTINGFFENNGSVFSDALSFFGAVSNIFDDILANNNFGFLRRIGNIPQFFHGSHLLLTETPTHVEPEKVPGQLNFGGGGTVTYFQGLAVLGGDLSMIFSNDKEKYGIYSHEIAHNLDCTHTFRDEDPEYLNRSANSIIRLNRMERAATDTLINNHNVPGTDADAYRRGNPDEITGYTEIITREQYRQNQRTNNTPLTQEEQNQETLDIARKEQILINFHQWMINENRIQINDPNYQIEIDNYNRYKNLMPLIIYKRKETSNAIMDYVNKHDDFFLWEWRLIKNKCSGRIARRQNQIHNQQQQQQQQGNP